MKAAMNIREELAMIERLCGGVFWDEPKVDNEVHPFFKPEINYDRRPFKREQEWVTVERFVSQASDISSKIKNGSMGKFDAYMMVIGKWPEMFDYEREMVMEKPCLKEFFEIIKQF
jgi:hypothetical protein